MHTNGDKLPSKVMLLPVSAQVPTSSSNASNQVHPQSALVPAPSTTTQAVSRKPKHTQSPSIQTATVAVPIELKLSTHTRLYVQIRKCSVRLLRLSQNECNMRVCEVEREIALKVMTKHFKTWYFKFLFVLVFVGVMKAVARYVHRVYFGL